MPTPETPRHQAFAQARASGVLPIGACESAGFVRQWGHPGHLASMEEVAERVAESRVLQMDIEDISPWVCSPPRGASSKAGEGSENPTLANDARLAAPDVSRPRAAPAGSRADERGPLAKVFKDLTAEGSPMRRKKRISSAHRRPASAPSAPKQRPSIAPRAPHNLPASAAASPLALPGLAPHSGSLSPEGPAPRKPG